VHIGVCAHAQLCFAVPMPNYALLLVAKHRKDGKEPVVGFCFSFAMKQTAINAGTLLAWTKGFTCSGESHHHTGPLYFRLQTCSRCWQQQRRRLLLHTLLAAAKH
jgi:hypothetical protein